MEKTQLWGTFSVIDHTRPCAFAAEALIYDKLVVPVPPAGDGEAYGRWRRNQWAPDRQREIIDILGAADLLLEIPWDAQMVEDWGVVQKGSAGGRFELQRLREDLKFAAQSEDDLPYLNTSGLLMACVQGDVDNPAARQLVALAKTSDEPIDTVIAYRGYQEALDAIDAEIGDLERSDERFHMLSWEYFFPVSDDPEDLTPLRQAVKVASMPELKDVRRSFTGWINRLGEAEVDAEKAVRELDRLQREFKDLSGSVDCTTVLRWAGRLSPIAVPFAALIDPATGAWSASFSALAGILSAYLPVRATPERLLPAKYVSEAKRVIKA